MTEMTATAALVHTGQPSLNLSEEAVPVPSITTASTGLLVMDLQAGILSDLPGAGALVQRVNSVLAEVRKRDMFVGVVQVAFTPEDYERIPDRNLSFSQLSRAGRLALDDPSSGPYETLALQGNEPVFRKTRVGAFSTTNLADSLAQRQIDTLALAGVATSGVILSTVRDAADRDFGLIVLADCCLDRDVEVHRVLLEKVLPRQAHVLSSEEFLQALPANDPTT
ncbi:MAG: cysteine hydrolase [Mycobacterium sp.]|nr:cysteine hydrolase [Mycobacterium sp.]